MKATSFDVSEESFRDSLLKSWDNMGDRTGILKEATDVSTKLVRRSIKETGFMRLIQPWEPMPDSGLYERMDHEEPAVMCHMEPKSKGAKAIPFSDTADAALWRGDKFLVLFAKISTPWYTKSEQELRTYTYDLRKVVADNGVREIHTAEDSRFIAQVDRLVGSPGGLGAAGIPQVSTVAGSIERSNYKNLLSDLKDRMIPNGTFLLNARTSTAFLDMDANVIGDEMAGKSIRDGLDAFTADGGKLTIMTVPHVATIKNSIVVNNDVYQFGPVDFLGRAFMLEELKMYVEKKVDIIRFAAWEICGFSIANVAAIHKTRFEYAG